MKLSYRGFDKSGKAVSGTVEAADRHEAGEQLLKRGIYVSEIGETRAAAPPVNSGGGFGGGKRQDQLAVFLRQLAVLVSTGTTLVDAIASLERQQKAGPWKVTLAALRERVEEGVQLSDAMAHYPAYFDGVCRSLVAAGESGGKLDVMLQRLSGFVRQRVKVRKQVVGAMVYPCLLIVVAFVVTSAMIGFVLPRFEGLFTTLSAELPPTTAFLMAVSRVVRAYWYLFVGGLVGGPVGLYFWLGTGSGRRFREQFALRAPQLGKLTRGFATARIARVLGVLLDGKVPMLDALRLTGQAVGHSSYAALIAKAEEAVTRGESVSHVLADPRLIDPSACEAIRSGERTGQVSAVLLSVAYHLDEDNEVMLKTVTGLLEPLILIGLGVVVGAMAISMFLPLFDLTATGGGGH